MKGKRLEKMNECELCHIAINTLWNSSGKCNVNKLPEHTNEAINAIMQVIKWHMYECNKFDDGKDLKKIAIMEDYFKEKYKVMNTLGRKPVNISIFEKIDTNTSNYIEKYYGTQKRDQSNTKDSEN